MLYCISEPAHGAMLVAVQDLFFFPLEVPVASDTKYVQMKRQVSGPDVFLQMF